MRILIVEDEPKTGDYLRKGLQENGYIVDLARDGTDGLHLAMQEDYDLIVLDVMLPGMDGWEVLKKLRETKATAVLFLTSRDDVNDRVKGLELGADDYLVKPFDLQELLARIQALLRRRTGRADALVQHGSLVLNTTTHAVTLDGAGVALSAREFAVLQALLERPGAFLSVPKLEEKIYGWGDEVGCNTL